MASFFLKRGSDKWLELSAMHAHELLVLMRKMDKVSLKQFVDSYNAPTTAAVEASAASPVELACTTADECNSMHVTAIDLLAAAGSAASVAALRDYVNTNSKRVHTSLPLLGAVSTPHPKMIDELKVPFASSNPLDCLLLMPILFAIRFSKSRDK